MCGIFGYIGKKENAAQLVLEGLKRLEYRGYDSWGVAIVPTEDPKIQRSLAKPDLASRDKDPNEHKEIIIKKRIGKIGGATVDELPKSHFGFGHTRWATHGGVTQVNAHPHLSSDKQTAIVHNGIIENYDVLRVELKKKGYTFISETDTEVAVHLISEYLKQYDLPEAVRRAFNRFVGLNALIAINTKGERFVAVRNGSPLVVGFGRDENYLASDPAALLPHTKEVYFVEDNELLTVDEKQVSVFDVQTNRKKKITKQKLSWDASSSEKGTYPHFMLKEIHEQPAILMRILLEGLAPAKKLAAIIKRSQGTYMVGCGTAAYACISGAYIFSKIAKTHMNWAIGSEFSYQLDFLTKKSLVIALSQSGETMDTLEAVKKAKEKGAHVACIVNVLGSSLYRESEYRLMIGAGPEKGVASTKAFTGKLAHIILIASMLAGKPSYGKHILQQAVHSSKSVLMEQSIDHITKLSQRIKNSKDMYVIGRGLSYPASLESALKIKEVSYIHAEGFAAGELKHGPLALITKGTPCMVFCPNDETYGANLAGAMEMKARGGFIIGVSYKPHEVFDEYIKVPDANEATIIPNVIVGQLLGYYLAVSKGLDPDMPRNLAKSVTVK